ncbi:membrane bound O-acyl transferase MBOAT family protein [Cellulophaga lytica DSM 7489]|uniref:Membrane bound O-acyl transferase MBOAT family protein n=1 Tax=Cellulophaga lytica (strain ATCC 23178 / DSM 7489 / JCM 8516 / NBRC 14961 / NCIMB 1423 / VKM B-1433 / Cy l20) TaxID=867900 RepID=F0R9U4_CELLC|nr:MBOAT family O-acyltransferase [Cellulophaga lytica]ADY30439.1 membrane bound O-acyl transferase MBOAT family protein [Cellulophaga lytica DSM 7489]WQG78629.1 MBOAT family O-acyltransferase [Cellulophaga lytica]
MLFNSLDFAIFLPIVFFIYWFLVNKSIKKQNIVLLVASYVFYGWWDWRFLSLILFSTIVDYCLGNLMYRTEKVSRQKIFLYTSLFVNLGLLFYFKYCNFFLDNFINAFSFFGLNFNVSTLKVILPVGISFYTFQTLSYTIDIYRRNLEPAEDFISFAAFVSFFPQLVAGPIERATNLLPQFYKRRVFSLEKAKSGLRQILWGLFKKIVIADQCAKYVNIIFDNSDGYSGSTLLVGAILFAFQIYGDFSGYSDIAIGVSRLFGFNLMKNFAFPYFSRDIAEFWRRWHISLSTWFRDYLYIPLGGSRGGLKMKIRNTFIIFLVSGFWHGANWTFVIWGALNAIYFLPLLLFNKNRSNMDVIGGKSYIPTFKDFVKMLLTFSLTVFAWIFFRALNLEHALSYIVGIFDSTIFSTPEVAPFFLNIYILSFLIIEWFGKNSDYAIEKLFVKRSRVIRWAFYMLIVFVIIGNVSNQQDFIYFQF